MRVIKGVVVKRSVLPYETVTYLYLACGHVMELDGDAPVVAEHPCEYGCDVTSNNG